MTDKCERCGRRPAAEVDAWFIGPGGVEEGPFGPVITGCSMSMPLFVCGPTCEAEAMKLALTSLGPGWKARQERPNSHHNGGVEGCSDSLSHPARDGDVPRPSGGE